MRSSFSLFGFLFGFGALAALAASCSNRGSAPPAAPVDVTVADVGDAGSVVPGIAPPKRKPADARCTARLLAGALEKAPSCNVDTKITEGPGTLTYPCGGDGKAEALFGDQRIPGSIHGGYLRLEIRTNPDWNDGCSWQSRQLIEGYVKDGKVGWKYDETLLDDSHGGCFTPCEAQTTIELELDD